MRTYATYGVCIGAPVAFGLREALELAAAPNWRIDVTVTDVIMREMGGLGLTRRLTATKPRLRDVSMSGSTERTVKEVGSRPLLQKPFERGELAVAIREVLDVAPAA